MGGGRKKLGRETIQEVAAIVKMMQGPTRTDAMETREDE